MELPSVSVGRAFTDMLRVRGETSTLGEGTSRRGEASGEPGNGKKGTPTLPVLLRTGVDTSEERLDPRSFPER